MTYRDQSDLYRSLSERTRFEICVIEQGVLYMDDPDPNNANLGKLVVSGDKTAINTVVAAICVGPNWATLDDDLSLLAAVQGAWPTVAAAWA